MLNQVSFPKKKINLFLKENQGSIVVENFKIVCVNKEVFFIIFYNEKETDKKYVVNILPRGKWAAYYESNKDKNIKADCYYDVYSQKLCFATIEEHDLDVTEEVSMSDKVAKANEMISLEKSEEKKGDKVKIANEFLADQDKINESKIKKEISTEELKQKEAKEVFNDFTTDDVVPQINTGQEFAASMPTPLSTEKAKEKNKDQDRKSSKKNRSRS